MKKSNIFQLCLTHALKMKFDLIILFAWLFVCLVGDGWLKLRKTDIFLQNELKVINDFFLHVGTIRMQTFFEITYIYKECFLEFHTILSYLKCYEKPRQRIQMRIVTNFIDHITL